MLEVERGASRDGRNGNVKGQFVTRFQLAIVRESEPRSFLARGGTAGTPFSVSVR